MIFIGYDPGGNHKHGVATLVVEDGRPVQVVSALVDTAERAIHWFNARTSQPVAIGVDTLTCWSTGPSGWRPADRWLRARYAKVQASVASPNSLYGSMSINGMATLIALKSIHPSLVITETHPKVLHWHLAEAAYDFMGNRAAMRDVLTALLGFSHSCEADHEWDAVISALAAFYGISGQWALDLHRLETTSGERLISPCGETKYFWPG